MDKMNNKTNDFKAFISDLASKSPVLNKIRAGVNTIKNGGDTPMIQPVIIQDPNYIADETGNVQMQVPKERLMEKFANGLGDFSTGFNENKNNAFMPSNLTDNKFSNGEDKGFMARLGEAFGTGARTMNRPGVKGLATGLITTALTGSPMFGFTTGLNTANVSAGSDVYARALQEQGINVPTGVFNTYSGSDLSALMQPQYKQQELDLKILKEQMLNEWRKAQAENRAEKNDIDRNYKENKIINEQKKIANGGGNGKKDVTQDEQRNKDLATYFRLKANPQYADKLNELRAIYVQQHGVDPEQYDKG